MSDDLRERIERVLYAEAIRWAAACTTGDGPYPLAERQADAVLAVLRDTPKVCRTCGSDDPRLRVCPTCGSRKRAVRNYLGIGSILNHDGCCDDSWHDATDTEGGRVTAEAMCETCGKPYSLLCANRHHRHPAEGSTPGGGRINPRRPGSDTEGDAR